MINYKNLLESKIKENHSHILMLIEDELMEYPKEFVLKQNDIPKNIFKYIYKYLVLLGYDCTMYYDTISIEI